MTEKEKRVVNCEAKWRDMGGRCGRGKAGGEWTGVRIVRELCVH